MYKRYELSFKRPAATWSYTHNYNVFIATLYVCVRNVGKGFAPVNIVKQLCSAHQETVILQHEKEKTWFFDASGNIASREKRRKKRKFSP